MKLKVVQALKMYKLRRCATLKSRQAQELYTFRRFITSKSISVQKMYKGSQKQSLLDNDIGAAAWRDLIYSLRRLNDRAPRGSAKDSVGSRDPAHKRA